MAFYGGYGSYGGMYGGNMQQTYEQERVGYGPGGLGVNIQEEQINRNPYTGATSVVTENEFVPTGGYGFGYGGGYGGSYGYNRFI